jgi:hypothetical protein
VPARPQSRPKRPPRSRRRRPTRLRPRPSPTDDLLRGALLGGIVLTAIWLLFGTMP